MIIYNALIRNKLCSVEVENGIITSIGDNLKSGDLDAKGNRLIAGLIDVHTHGMCGYDTMDAEFEDMCKIYAEHGTTSFLPTTMTMGYDDLQKVCKAKTDYEGANILGFHFEGPYISKNRKGAQNEEHIKIPSVQEFDTFENVKMITVAPETKGAMDFIKAVSDRTVVSIGHTDCDYKTAIKAIENGANCLTHTFNAMPPLHHRDTGPIGAGFSKQIYAQVICDGIHIDKSMIEICYKLFGDDKMVLISDSIRCAKMPKGEYECGGLKVFVNDNTARIENGSLAGSYACLLDCVKKAIEFGIDFDSAVKMATETPAKMLSLNKGKIEAGYDADLLIVDDKLNIINVIIGGNLYK